MFTNTLPPTASGRLQRPLPRTRGASTPSCCRGAESRQPALEIGTHERIVVEVRIGSADAFDLFPRSRPQRFARVEAPDASEQPLAAQDFMAAGEDAVEVVGDIEDRR